ncbi:DEAD/DEAH box helicase family protein [Desulfonatronovibrio magnus]|uniref:DEAD/DEAH box helicase family protein n=1 Tax=Desulfonatronovibrio magnus TaxID=698827 RepID=UPI0005EBD4E0|nr:DEAD/DEAH box helicase family protein [Desulfonatronovibrio magnus]
MPVKFLYDELDAVSRMGFLNKEIPDYLKDNLNPRFELRPYQDEAFARFFYCLNSDFPGKDYPLHLLFNMATGSGKTLIMAGLILYLYERGYRNFLFFVNSTNIIEKTKENFLNPRSSKFLFNEDIRFGTSRVNISQAINFEDVNDSDINICFTTTQKLHSDLTTEKENSITYEDFRHKKIVLLSDEAHHMNVSTTTGKMLAVSWENTVERIFRQNEDNILLEFTATLDYTQRNIVNKYRHKVIYRYDLRQFQDSYSFMWDAYEDTIFSLLMSEVKQLEGHIAQAIWFQTGDGIDWLVENENSPNVFYDESSIANHIMNEYVLTAADDWSNERIRKYLDGYWE